MAKVDLDAVLDASFEAVEKNGGHWPGPDLFCLPKVESADELTWLSETINQQLGRSNLLRNRPNLGLVAMIESCTAVIQLPVICQKATCLSIPLVGVVFGSDDYCVTLGVERSPTNVELSHPRQFVPVVAKAFGLAAIDMVDIDFKDNAKLKANCALGAQFGFNGKQTIHPAQLPVVNQAFAPSQSREEWANALLKAAKAHHSTGQAVGAHAFTFRGRMIDRPTLRQAEHIVNLTKLVNLRAQAQ
ncbi:Citrate lyase subunit beta protein mitochondrial [Fasciola hepatica]|uniref:Citrate lyase subunit beta protein mitochondrial n=1 Tax=Fasciola hepatica TaxID=6192 RepID=A0A4E0RSJ7_FASHE|nr:Citrate lyase subunit beta protein mitochondrial [Fasciola hepatica]